MTTSPGRSLESWLAYIQRQHARTIDLNLSRVRRVWHALGAPNPPFTILVAGTNGKGSSVAMLESILLQAGYTTGTYTSPHLVSYNERIRINQVVIDAAAIISGFERIEAARGDTTLTYFEYSTLVALVVFEACRVEAGILEVGLGGRLDATNIVDHQVALISSIGLDHQSWLGSDREAIGGEKAGIIRYRGISVCSDPNPPRRLLQIAEAKISRHFQINRDFRLLCRGDEVSWQCSHSSIKAEWQQSGVLELPFNGIHQSRNAAGAIMALVATRHLTGIQKHHISTGLAAARIEARQQVIDSQPELILDVAHNREAIAELVNFLQANPVAGSTHAVIGILADKPVRAMVALLNSLIDYWYPATLDCERGMPATDIESKIKAVDEQNSSECFSSPVAAYQAALERAKPEDRLVIVGSFVTVGDIIRLRRLKSEYQDRRFGQST